MLTGQSKSDVITGLESKTRFGRPNWDVLFKELATAHKGDEVDVYFCGPPVLSKLLYRKCRHYTNTDTKFVYHKENF